MLKCDDKGKKIWSGNNLSTYPIKILKDQYIILATPITQIRKDTSHPNVSIQQQQRMFNKILKMLVWALTSSSWKCIFHSSNQISGFAVNKYLLQSNVDNYNIIIIIEIMILTYCLFFPLYCFNGKIAE